MSHCILIRSTLFKIHSNASEKKTVEKYIKSKRKAIQSQPSEAEKYEMSRVLLR